MKFTAKGRQYEVDKFGVHQVDHKPFVYDPAYSGIYDTPEYSKKSLELQKLRLDFINRVHGKKINSVHDCGYGNGAFMKFVAKHIPIVTGSDVTGVDVEGCYVFADILPANVITFWDCLEHIPDLSFVKYLLHETVCISLPYCHLRTHGKRWFETSYHHLKPDEHVHHFDEFYLDNLMDSMGWETVEISDHEDEIRTPKHGLQNILSMAFKRK